MIRDMAMRLGLIEPGEVIALRPLPGGVSSDIIVVRSASGHAFCVKQALARLKVSAVWEAPVGRNAAEADWLRLVSGWFPTAVPRLLGEDRALGLFVMDYLPAETHPVWKTQLLSGQADAEFAAAVGRALAAIHARSAAEPELASRFANAATFEQIRIEPYLRATARRHPDLASHLNRLADRTNGTLLALVHGDVSPKNILHGPQGPVFLDAECATWGDPAFDLAFCLNHLALKAVWRPASAEAYGASFAALRAAYLTGVDWEPAAALDARCRALLPALMLARVDGKSPVEYLDETQRATVRRQARALLLEQAGQAAF